MEKYDYRKAVKDDVIEYIKNNDLTAADFQNLADCQRTPTRLLMDRGQRYGQRFRVLHLLHL